MLGRLSEFRKLGLTNLKPFSFRNGEATRDWCLHLNAMPPAKLLAKPASSAKAVGKARPGSKTTVAAKRGGRTDGNALTEPVFF